MENLNPFEKADLIFRYLQDELNDEERAMVEDWLSSDEDNRKLVDGFRDREAVEKELALLSSGEKGKAWELIADLTGNESRVIRLQRRRRRSLSIAALALICLAGGGLVWLTSGNKAAKETVRTVKKENISLPVTGKTKLTLSDGSIIALDEASDGALYEDNTAKLVKSGGQLLYEDKAGDNELVTAYNTISTSVGGMYQVILPDKSKVWLNVASSLRYPTVFRDSIRLVELNGEAYFEVAKNRSMPFVVNAGGTKVEVVGTHFNIMAYRDEKETRTTLLEGAVIVSDHTGKKLMKPGQQAITNDGIRLVETDPETVVAWKQGLFHFDNAGIGLVMRQLVRWYDIEVVYEKGGIPDIHFTGIISRHTSLSQAIEMINVSGNLRLEVQGRKVIVKAVGK